MATTFTITIIQNDATNTSTVEKIGGRSWSVEAENSLTGLSILVPTCTSASEYSANHIVVDIEGLGGKFYFWHDGDNLYYNLSDSYSTSNTMTISGTIVPGENNNIRLVITEGGEGAWVIGDIDD